MALHRIIQIEMGVREPALMDDFYQEIGLTGGDGSWGGAEHPDQIRVVEAPYRQLRSIRLGCEDEQDLASAGKALDALGAKYEIGQGKLKLIDPINGWDVTIEPAEVGDLKPSPERLVNRPGDRRRLDVRAEAITESKPRPPRRLGHFVLGTPDPLATTPLFKALGFRVSDVIGGGMATFMRCAPDHHSLLIAPGRAPYLNHYALEHDDFDSVARAASLYLRKHGNDRHVSGPGRHQIGGNQFWYMLDVCGNTIEFFSDMDRIVDDEAWEIGTDWDPADSWSLWGDLQQPEIFFNPTDMDEIVAGWEAGK
ncbi:MAG: hypothetical protein GY946_16175 [bacterium]|nr:hypothetical protein [bacterium]